MNIFWTLLIIVIVVLLLWWLGRQEQREKAKNVSKAAPAEEKLSSGLPDVNAVVSHEAKPVVPEPVVQVPAAAVQVPEPVVEAPTSIDEVEAVAAEDAVPVETVVGVENPVEQALEAAMPVKADDLEIIEGIGPKIAAMLRAKGIVSFNQLASTELPELQKIMQEANLRIADPTTWADQAKLAGEGKWDDLKTLQDNLKGGRKVA